MPGLACCADDFVRGVYLKTDKTKSENAELIAVRLCFGLESIRLISACGPQVSDAKDEIEDFYDNLQIQLDRSVLEGDSVLSVGDLNANFGKTVINQGIHDMSANGKLLCDIIDKYNLCLVNTLKLCKGVFTRVNKKIVQRNMFQIMSLFQAICQIILFTFKRTRDLLIIMQLYLNCRVKGLKVLAGAIGKWFEILMMIRDGKVL